MAGRLPGQDTGLGWGSMLGGELRPLANTNTFLLALALLPACLDPAWGGVKGGAANSKEDNSSSFLSPASSRQRTKAGGRRAGREPSGKTKWAFDCPRLSPPGKPTLRLFIAAAAQPRRSLGKSHWQPAGPTKVPLFAEGAPGWVLSEGASSFPHPAPPALCSPFLLPRDEGPEKRGTVPRQDSLTSPKWQVVFKPGWRKSGQSREAGHGPSLPPSPQLKASTFAAPLTDPVCFPPFFCSFLPHGQACNVEEFGDTWKNKAGCHSFSFKPGFLSGLPLGVILRTVLNFKLNLGQEMGAATQHMFAGEFERDGQSAWGQSRESLQPGPELRSSFRSACGHHAGAVPNPRGQKLSFVNSRCPGPTHETREPGRVHVREIPPRFGKL